MITSLTAAGTPVVDLSAKEYDVYLNNEVKRATGMAVTEFKRAYEAGEIDDIDPAVSECIVLLRIGQG